MKEILNFIGIVLNAIVNLAQKYIGFDGLLHVIVPSILVVIVKVILPWYIAVIPAFVVSVAKELVYDKWMGKGECSWKDFACDIVGITIGAL